MLKYKILKELREKYEDSLIILKEDCNFRIDDPDDGYHPYHILKFKKDEFMMINKIYQKTYIDIHYNECIKYTCEIVYNFKAQTIILFDSYLLPPSDFANDLGRDLFSIK